RGGRGRVSANIGRASGGGQTRRGSGPRRKGRVTAGRRRKASGAGAGASGLPTGALQRPGSATLAVPPAPHPARWLRPLAGPRRDSAPAARSPDDPFDQPIRVEAALHERAHILHGDRPDPLLEFAELGEAVPEEECAGQVRELRGVRLTPDLPLADGIVLGP